MAGETIDDKVNQDDPTPEPKKEKGFFRKALDLGYLAAVAAGATAIGVATAGWAAPVIGLAFPGSVTLGSILKGGKSLYQNTRDFLKGYSAVNCVLAPMETIAKYLFPAAGALGAKLLGSGGALVGKIAAAETAFLGAFLVTYRTAEHFIGNYLNPKGLWHSITDKLGATCKRLALTFAPGLIIGSAMGIPYLTAGAGPYSITAPTFAYNAPFAGLDLGINPPGEKKDASILPMNNQPQLPQQPYNPQNKAA